MYKKQFSKKKKNVNEKWLLTNSQSINKCRWCEKELTEQVAPKFVNRRCVATSPNTMRKVAMFGLRCGIPRYPTAFALERPVERVVAHVSSLARPRCAHFLCCVRLLGVLFFFSSSKTKIRDVKIRVCSRQWIGQVFFIQMARDTSFEQKSTENQAQQFCSNIWAVSSNFIRSNLQ